MLLPGEDGRGVLGIPWLESGRKNLLRLLNVDAELGGDWPESVEYSMSRSVGRDNEEKSGECWLWERETGREETL
jgi:hypothetical protein